MTLISRKTGRTVHTSCIQPFVPYRRKRHHIKVRCVTKPDESYSLLAFAIVGWAAFLVMFVRWWVI